MKQIEELQERLEVIRSEAGCISEVNNNARMREMLRGWHDTIAACRERDEEIARLQEALSECMIEIDNTIDEQYPADAHLLWAGKNANLKALNPARIALTDTAHDEV
jgi:hypothetical protein